MRAEGITVDEINVQKPSLDEVFLTLTGKPAETAEAGGPNTDADSTHEENN